MRTRGLPPRRPTPPRSEETTCLDLIERIYAAAEDPRLWSDFLEGLAHSVGGTVTAMASEDLGSGHASVGAGVDFEGALSRAYEEYYASRNPWLNACLGRNSGSVVTSQMLLPDRVIVKTEYYNDFLRKMKVRHLLGAIIFHENHRLSHISVLRPTRRGAFGDPEVTLLNNLTPHLQRALQLHTRIMALRGEKDAIEEALDRVPVGILLLDRSGKALLVNRAASEMFASKDGLTLRPEGLAAATSGETTALRRLVTEAAATANGSGTGSGGVMAVSRPSLRRPFSVFVAPLTARKSAFAEVRPAVAVFVTDPERKLETDDGVLRCLYGFTPAESRVAVKLMQGESVEEAAGELDVSLNTARTHVKRLFEKTDTHRHRELLRVLLSGIATIRTH